MKPTKIAMYVRVSTFKPDEKHKAQDTGMQIRELTNYLKFEGLTDFEVYEDKGHSGTKSSRPALNRLMADCRAGKIQMVLCWKLDRLFRSLRHLVNTLEEFAALKVEFVALKDSIDLSTHTGRFMMQILGAVAEFDAAVIRERTNAGLAHAVASGKRLGRRPKATVDVAGICWGRANGSSLKTLAKEHDLSVTTIQRVLAGTRGDTP